MVSKQELHKQNWGFSKEGSPWRIIPDIHFDPDQVDVDFEKSLLKVHLPQNDVELLQQAAIESSEGYVEAVLGLGQMDLEDSLSLFSSMIADFGTQIVKSDVSDSFDTWLVGLGFLSEGNLREVKQQAIEKIQVTEFITILETLVKDLYDNLDYQLDAEPRELEEDRKKINEALGVFEHIHPKIVLQPIEKEFQDKTVVYQRQPSV